MAKVNGCRYEAVKQGGPFEVAEYELGPPEPNEVLIRNRAVALNPVDYKLLYVGASFQFVRGHPIGTMQKGLTVLLVQLRELGLGTPFPATFGFDGAGVIEAVGSEVKGLNKGDEVFGDYTGGKEKSAAFQVGESREASRLLCHFYP